MDKLKSHQRIYERIIIILLALFALTSASPLTDYGSIMKKNCPSTCSCGSLSSPTDFEIQCPPIDPQIVVRIQANTYVLLECQIFDQKAYTQLPPLTVGDVPIVQIRRCPLPSGSPIQLILDRLGVKKIRALIIQNYGGDSGPLLRDHLKGLSDLEKLVLNNIGLSNLPEDLFSDMKNLTWLDLRSNRVILPRNIFASLEKLDYLELGYNNLATLEPEILRNQKRLKHLNLWSNRLTNLTKESFEGATSVIELDLSVNGIETFDPDVFTLLKNLTTLNLSNNIFKSLPEGLFRENKKLSHLRLLDNRAQLLTLPSGLLSNLPELEEILIKCQLKTIPENLFSGSTNLRNLSLARNLIESVPAGLFADQINLLDLDLSHNKLTELPDDLFANTRSLLVLSLSHNQLVNISRSVFRNLRDLQMLYLNDNRLHHIHPHAFSGTNAIQVIHAENNYLSFKEEEVELEAFQYEIASPFQRLNKLRSLFLRNNSIESITADWMLNLIQLQDLDLSYNKIKLLNYYDVQFLSQQITVNLTHNQIVEIDFKELEFRNFMDEAVHERNVVVLIDSNPLICSCVILHFVLFLRNELAPNVKSFLKISTGNLQCTAPPQLNGRLVTDVNPRELLCPLDSEYSNNKKCPNECMCFVRTYDRALIVNCSNADLTKVPALPRLSSLNLNFTELYIENNNIMKLPKANTPGYADVRLIYARNNNISHISSDNLPKNLELLDLSENNLERLNVSVLRALNQTSKSVKKLYLGSNPWTCDCNAVELVSFVYTNFKKIHDLEKLQCTSGEKISALQPSSLCSPEEGIIIATSVLIALLGLCIGTLAALYYKYQQEVKVWLFAHNMCLWFVTEEELDKDKKYDAFISYSHKDEDFVTEHLVPELESGQTPFKLCLHIRDWVVGEFIPNQIAKSVDDSRRTIVVLSPNFLESIWGRMEFRAAHTAALSEGRARVIVIIYGDIGDTEKLDAELKAYLKMNTYVKWGDPWFWDKLRYAMPHLKSNSNSRTIGLVKTAIKSSTDDKLELIKPSPVTPPLTTPPAEQASKNPLVAKLNGEINHQQNGKISNGIVGHVNGAFIINTNAKQSDV